jgi:uncharacterized RDD family membrane protein YckC
MILVKRIAAYVIDLFLLCFLLWFYSSKFGTPSINGSGYTLSNMELAMMIFVWHLYFISFEYFFQATPGKIILKLKVLQLNNERPGIIQIIKRRSLDILELIFISILAPLLALFSAKGQRLGDMFAGTTVKEANKKTALEQLS